MPLTMYQHAISGCNIIDDGERVASMEDSKLCAYHINACAISTLDTYKKALCDHLYTVCMYGHHI